LLMLIEIFGPKAMPIRERNQRGANFPAPWPVREGRDRSGPQLGHGPCSGTR
jgi:hypothetical protein